METSGVYFGSLKTFLLSVKLENIRVGTSLNILVTQNSKTQGESNRNMLPRNNADVTHCEKTQCSTFKAKHAVNRSEHRPADIYILKLVVIKDYESAIDAV